MTIHRQPTRANKALVPTAGAALSAMLSVTLTRHPVSTLTPRPGGRHSLDVRPTSRATRHAQL